MKTFDLISLILIICLLSDPAPRITLPYQNRKYIELYKYGLCVCDLELLFTAVLGRFLTASK